MHNLSIQEMNTKNYLTVLSVLLLLLSNYPSVVNAQGGNKDLNLHLETGYGIKLDKGDYNSFQIYLSPSYGINNVVNAGVGTGLVLCIEIYIMKKRGS